MTFAYSENKGAGLESRADVPNNLCNGGGLRTGIGVRHELRLTRRLPCNFCFNPRARTGSYLAHSRVTMDGSRRSRRGISIAFIAHHSCQREIANITSDRHAWFPDAAVFLRRSLHGLVPAAQWNGSEMKNVPSPLARAAASCHSRCSCASSSETIRSSRY